LHLDRVRGALGGGGGGGGEQDVRIVQPCIETVGNRGEVEGEFVDLPVRVLGQPLQVQALLGSTGFYFQGPGTHLRWHVLGGTHLDIQGDHRGAQFLDVEVGRIGDLEGDGRRTVVALGGGKGQGVCVHHQFRTIGVGGPHRGEVGQLHLAAGDGQHVVFQCDLQRCTGVDFQGGGVGTLHRAGVLGTGHLDERVGGQVVLIGDAIGDDLSLRGQVDLQLAPVR